MEKASFMVGIEIMFQSMYKNQNSKNIHSLNLLKKGNTHMSIIITLLHDRNSFPLYKNSIHQHLS